MKDIQIKRVVYGDNHAFKEGVEVGRKEMIEKACEWLKEHYAPAGFVDGIFRKAMED